MILGLAGALSVEASGRRSALVMVIRSLLPPPSMPMKSGSFIMLLLPQRSTAAEARPFGGIGGFALIQLFRTARGTGQGNCSPAGGCHRPADHRTEPWSPVHRGHLPRCSTTSLSSHPGRFHAIPFVHLLVTRGSAAPLPSVHHIFPTTAASPDPFDIET